MKALESYMSWLVRHSLIRTAFCGVFHYRHNKEPCGIILVIVHIQASILSWGVKVVGDVRSLDGLDQLVLGWFPKPGVVQEIHRFRASGWVL